MKKPAGVTTEQLATYTGHIAFALERMNKCLDLIADANFQAGEQVERERIVKLVTDSQAINPDQKYFLLKAIKGEQK